MPRVALVHDFLLDLRGAERVFAAICDAWPDADVFTAVYDEQGTEGRFAARHPRASFLQSLRPTARTFRVLLPQPVPVCLDRARGDRRRPARAAAAAAARAAVALAPVGLDGRPARRPL